MAEYDEVASEEGEKCEKCGEVVLLEDYSEDSEMCIYCEDLENEVDDDGEEGDLKVEKDE